MSTLGEHYIIELYGCRSETLNHFDNIQSALNRAADIAGATIVDSKFHRFSPQGVSGVVIIAESHLSIHTWPEHGYAALDLFTCKMDMEINAALALLKEVFQPEDMEVRVVHRGIVDPALRRQQSDTLERLDTVPV